MNQKDKIISLAKEYVENVECTCVGVGDGCCWKCLLEYNLGILEYEQDIEEQRTEMIERIRCYS